MVAVGVTAAEVVDAMVEEALVEEALVLDGRIEEELEDVHALNLVTKLPSRVALIQ